MSNGEVSTSHFKGKEAMAHVVEVQAHGKFVSEEIHGAEAPGYLVAATDAARDSAIFFLLLSLFFLSTPITNIWIVWGVFIGWIFWKMGRSAWLGWIRLERLHRLMAEEKWEIDNHREQERSELTALYAAKGFEGKLLDDVIDVLMSDNDRLLRVMLEEELGLSLEDQDHPLKQGLGAGMGALITLAICSLSYWFGGMNGLIGASFAMIAFAAGLSAYLEKNRVVNAVIWNLGIAVLSYGSAYFLIDFFS